MAQAFTLGEHAQAIRGLQHDMAEVKADVKTLLGRDERRKGAYGIIVGVASFSGAAVALLVSWIKG